VAGVYLAGDGAGILGADAAEQAGERAALALLEDHHGRPARARPARNRWPGIGASARAWRPPSPSGRLGCPGPRRTGGVPLRDISAGELRAAVRETGAPELNRLKA
jgi:hypothetical protein